MQRSASLFEIKLEVELAIPLMEWSGLVNNGTGLCELELSIGKPRRFR